MRGKFSGRTQESEWRCLEAIACRSPRQPLPQSQQLTVTMPIHRQHGISPVPTGTRCCNPTQVSDVERWAGAVWLEDAGCWILCNPVAHFDVLPVPTRYCRLPADEFPAPLPSHIALPAPYRQASPSGDMIHPAHQIWRFGVASMSVRTETEVSWLEVSRRVRLCSGVRPERPPTGRSLER